MNAVLFDRHEYDARYALGWTLSLLLHGGAIGAAVVLSSQLHLAPQPDPFRWDVSLVGATNSPAATAAPAASTESIAAQAAPASPAVSTPAAPSPAERPTFTPTKTPRAAAPESPMIAARPRESHIQAVHSPAQAMPAPSSDALTHTDVPQSAAQDAPPSPPSQSTSAAQDATPSRPSHAPESAPFEDAPSSPAQDTQTVVRLPENASSASTGLPDIGSSASLSNALPQSQTGRPSPAMMGKPDFGWLATSLRNKVLESQKYSTVARLNGMEGRVVLRITVKENGELLVAVAKSSGHELLDKEAVKQVQNLSPFPLTQPLGRAQQVLNLPIIYSLNQ